VAIKHHAKNEVKEIMNCLNCAGIKGVLFSKEDIIRSQSLAQDLGIEIGWNTWMSLEDDKGLKVENIMGKTIIPFGIEEIR
jgi:hypothetical protein